MKKRVIIIALLTVILFSVVAAASAESKADYYVRIGVSLEKLRAALADKDKPAANIALGEVRTNVYAAMRYLATIGEYDARAMAIADNANKAYTACFNGLSWEEYFNEATAFNYIVLARDLPVEINETEHS